MSVPKPQIVQCEIAATITLLPPPVFVDKALSSATRGNGEAALARSPVVHLQSG